MLNVRRAGGHPYGKQLFTWLSLVVSLVASFCAVLFPTRCLGWDLGPNWVSFWGISYLLLLTKEVIPVLLSLWFYFSRVQICAPASYLTNDFNSMQFSKIAKIRQLQWTKWPPERWHLKDFCILSCSGGHVDQWSGRILVIFCRGSFCSVEQKDLSTVGIGSPKKHLCEITLTSGH